MVRLPVALLMLLVSQAGMAAVSAQLSAQTIDELETVRLSIKITETRQTGTLDLSELEQDFDVLNVNSMSQSRYINGRGQSWVDYQVTLQPLRTGLLKIPPIKVGTELTPSLTLQVNPLTDATRHAIDELVFFETSVSAERIYVQAQLVFSRALLYSQGVQLYSDLPGAPEIEDAVVLTLGETTSSTTERYGRTYGVVEQRYAVFPETSGSLQIPAIDITASVRLNENGRMSRKGVRVATEAQTITVLPVPPSYPADAPWLPAANVHIAQATEPADAIHNVGDTLEHRLMVQIQGNIGTIAPPLPLVLPDDQFRIYPQAPQITDDTQGDSVTGMRLQANAIVPLQPGNLALPQTQLIWWDTVNDRMRIAQAPGTILSVIGEAARQSPVVPSNTPQTSDDNGQKEAPQAPLATSLDWQWLRTTLAFLALLGLTGVCGWWLITRRGTQSSGAVSRTVTLKQLRRRLAKATAADAHRELLEFVASRRHCPLSQAAQTFAASSSEAHAAYDRLQSVLYGAGGELTRGDRTALLQAATELDRRQPRHHPSSSLPELYPAGL